MESNTRVVPSPSATKGGSPRKHNGSNTSRKVKLKRQNTLVGSADGHSGKSLFILSVKNPIRACAIRIVHSPLFESTIIFIIVLNCVMLTLGSPFPVCCGDDIQS